MVGVKYDTICIYKERINGSWIRSQRYPALCFFLILRLWSEFSLIWSASTVIGTLAVISYANLPHPKLRYCFLVIHLSAVNEADRRLILSRSSYNEIAESHLTPVVNLTMFWDSSRSFIEVGSAILWASCLLWYKSHINRGFYTIRVRLLSMSSPY